LSRYFAVVDCSDNTISDAKQKYMALGPLDARDMTFLPHKFGEGKRLAAVSFEAFLKLAESRASIRWFANKPVERELLDLAFRAALSSPSACNRQPYEYRVLLDKHSVSSISAIVPGMAGYAETVPVLIAAIGKLNYYFHRRDRHLIYTDTALATMTLVYAMETLGLGTCIINWPDIPYLQKRMKRELQLKAHEQITHFVAAGYPDSDGLVPSSPKKHIDDIRFYAH
jgi:nitroreductase